MTADIETRLDEQIDMYIVRMPELVSLEQLQRWSREFVRLLTARETEEKAALLMDTNTHKFESIECLKFLRDFLSQEPAIAGNLSHAAFVSPKDTRPAQVVSANEAYFHDYDAAYQWLMGKYDEQKT